jgi:hypothetical protein
VRAAAHVSPGVWELQTAAHHYTWLDSVQLRRVPLACRAAAEPELLDNDLDGALAVGYAVLRPPVQVPQSARRRALNDVAALEGDEAGAGTAGAGLCAVQAVWRGGRTVAAREIRPLDVRG